MPKRFVDTAIWSDRRFADLSAAAQLVYLRLVTGDDTGPAGATQVSPKRLAVDTNLERREVEAALEELVQSGLVRRYDDWLWIPAWVRYQLSGPGFIRAVRRQAKECPDALRLAIGRAVDAMVGPKGSKESRQKPMEREQENPPLAGQSGSDPEPTTPQTPEGPASDAGLFEREVQDQDPRPLRGLEGPSGTAVGEHAPARPGSAGAGRAGVGSEDEPPANGSPSTEAARAAIAAAATESEVMAKVSRRRALAAVPRRGADDATSAAACTGCGRPWSGVGAICDDCCEDEP